MLIDWLKSLRSSTTPRRRRSWLLATPTPLESRMLLSTVPLGSEVRVSTRTVNTQSTPKVGMDADGNYVIAWVSNGQDGSGTSIYIQRYNALGVPQGFEVRVNSWVTGAQYNPAVAMDADGDFVVTWQSDGQDGSGEGIYAQRYNALGVPQGSEFRVNTTTDSHQRQPSIRMDPDGDFVIAWSSLVVSSPYSSPLFGIYAQRYNAQGIPQGSEFRVSSIINRDSFYSSIAMDADGDFVIAYHSNTQDGFGAGVFAQRYNAAGVPQGSEFQANSRRPNSNMYPSVAMDSDGDFVITWQSNNQDGSGYGIYAQRYNALGTPQGSEFQVNTYTSSYQRYPSVAMNAVGEFVIAWASLGQDGSGDGIYAQRYDALGLPQDSEFQVNSWTTNNQTAPSIGMDADGVFVIAWSSYLQDGSSEGIYAYGLNYTPTDIGLSGNEIQEYEHPGAPIGAFSSTDANSSDTFTYTLVTGPGDTDNAAFTIVGNQLHNAVVFDYETQNTYSIRVRTTDHAGATFEKVFSISVIDGPETGAIPLGSEFKTAAGSLNQSVAMDAHGNFVIAWSTSNAVFAQRYSAFGTPREAPFLVSSTAYSDRELDIAMNPDGNFVIAWESQGIYARRYNALGVPQGSKFLANTWTTNGPSRPSIAMDEIGDFVITWYMPAQDGSSYGIFAQRFDSLGIPQGSEFQVNTRTEGSQAYSSIAMDADGDFVITWQSGGDGWDYGIFAQRYNASGLQQGSEFRVNTWTTFLQAHPSIAMDDDGDFVITWQSYGPDGDSFGIAAQRYDRFGDPLGPEFRVNSWTTRRQVNSSIAMDAAGDFVIAWESDLQDGSGYGVYAQVFNSHGVPQGSEFRVNTRTSDFQWRPSIGMNADGDFVITWKESGSGAGVYAHRYTLLESGPNLAPLLDNAGAPYLNPILQNNPTATNIGTLVSDIIARVSPDGSISDPDLDPLGIAINGLTGTANGTWEFTVNGGTTWLPIGTTGNFDARLLAADLNTRIRFLPNTDFIGQANIAFVAWDRTSGANGSVTSVNNRGGTTPYSLAYEYAAIDVNNAAPILNNAGTPTLDPINMNVSDVDNIGTLVSDIIARMSPNGSITDPNPNALRGIALFDFTNIDTGDWQYTTDNGTTWHPVGTTGIGNARLLAADQNTRIRYAPHIGYQGTPGFTFVAWDRTAGVNGATADVNSRGGTTPYSTASDLAVITVRNIAPILNNAGSPTLDPILMNVADVDNPGTLVSDIIARMGPAGGITVLNPGGLKGIAINGLTNTTNGTWEFTTNNGTTWSPIGTTGNFNARLLAADPNTRIRYRPNIGFFGEAKIAFVAWDQTASTNGGVANVNNRGGITPYSLAYEYASIKINNVAPLLNNAGSPTLDSILMNVSSVDNHGTLISDIIARMSPAGGISDLNPNSPQGIAINGLTGPASGIWEYSVNNGTNWSPIGSTGNFDARLLAADPNTRIRYRPNPGFIGEANIAFVAWDRSAGANGGIANVNNRGGSTPYSLAYEYASIFVNNAAPILNNSGSPTLDPIPQNVFDVFNHGTLVSDVIARMSPAGSITDPNPASQQGIAVIGLGNTDTGNWQYTTNNGATWNLIGTTGPADARLLASDPNTRIRYRPNIGFLGEAQITFVAWDRTIGANGVVANAVIRGGTTPFSLTDETAGILVVNAAPILTPTNASYLDSIPMNVPSVANVGTLVSDIITRIGPNGILDPNPAALQGIAINGLTGTANGTWEFTTNGGTSWSSIGTTGNSDARLLAADPNTRIRFVPNLNFTGIVKLAFVAWDQTSGTNGGIANTSTRGNSTPFSTLYDYASLTII